MAQMLIKTMPMNTREIPSRLVRVNFDPKNITAINANATTLKEVIAST